MDLLTYLLKKNKNTNSYPIKSDLLAYLLAKGKPEEKTESGTTLEIEASRSKFNELTLEKESTQETTTGKNLFKYPYPSTRSGTGITFTENSKGGIEISGTATSNNYYNYYPASVGSMLHFNAGTYTFSFSTLPPNCNGAVGFRNEDGTPMSGVSNLYLSSNTLSGTRTINQEFWISCYIGVPNETVVESTLVLFQAEAGSTPTAYEPYTGGIPSPNPDYPQEINVIKDSLTIEITDGENTKTATIDLGDNEVVGIGDYKDIIKVDRSGNVTLTKKTGKVVLDGSETGWSYISVAQGSLFRISNYITDVSKDKDINLGLSNYFINITYNQISNRKTGDFYFSYSNENYYLDFIYNAYNNINDFKYWLSIHNVVVYYILETPEDPISLGNIDLTLFRGSNTITNSEDAYMTIKYY